MESGGHLLALKVMRVSRPSLLGQWQPFSSSPQFDGYVQSSLTSMQHLSPHVTLKPSTVHDFNVLSQLLSLPSSFGTISLGESFTSILSVTNSTSSTIEGVSLHVSLVSSTTKTVLLETPPTTLGPATSTPSPLTHPPSVTPNTPNTSVSTLESTITSEIKELGQHTLTCLVTYRVPAHIRAPQASDDPSDPRKMIFRKHYRFPVTNPFNVKTKVHVPRSPGMLMDRREREKVFLEVHVMNLTGEGMWFERLEFKPVDGWIVEDGNLDLIDDEVKEDSKFAVRKDTNKRSLINPQDTNQYVYILTPSNIPLFPTKPIPGSIIPLGRLDMAWRSTLGEPGRLLTSMLSRRIPAAVTQVTQALPALPPHVQRAIAAMPRPRSPTPSISSLASTTVVASTPSAAAASNSGSRPSSPVPYKSRQPNPNRPQTPVQSHPHPNPMHAAPTAIQTDIQVDLVVDEIHQADGIVIDDPFSITFTAAIAAFATPSKKRLVSLGVQHVIHRRPNRPAANTTTVNTTTNLTKRIVPNTTHSPTPSALSTPRIQSIDFAAHPLVESPRKHRPNSTLQSARISLPSPYADDSELTDVPIGTGQIEFLGASFVRLPPFMITHESPSIDPPPGVQPSATTPIPATPMPSSAALEKRASLTAAGGGKKIASQQFTLDFLPTKMGLENVGGVRLLLLSDTEEEMEGDGEDRQRESVSGVASSSTTRVLHEWPVIAEVMVGGG